MKILLTFTILCFFGQLHAKPRIEQLGGIFIAKPIDSDLKRRAQQADRRNSRSDMILLDKLPEYKNIASFEVTLFAVSINGGNVASIEIRFKAEKGRRERLFAWIKEQTNLDPTDFEDGRLIYSDRLRDGYIKGISLGSYVVGMEDREYSVSISNQRM